MQDETGQLLYVGKARDLRKRLASYARYATDVRSKTAVMLSKVSSIDTILTNTEKEALILESSLIKKHRPKYNVILRDDKNYPLIKVTVDEAWPRVIMTRKRTKDGARYFGPFSSSSAMWATVNYLNSLFPLRRCKGKELKHRARPCLNYQMGRCMAPCTGKADPERYQDHVRNILMVLEGKNQQLLKELKAKMQKASDELRFEEAAHIRDQINALETTLEKQIMIAPHSQDQDIFGFARKGDAVAVAVIFVRQGMVNGQQSYYLAEPVGDDAEILTAVLERFYGEERPVPKEIILPFELNDVEALIEWLADLKGSKVYLMMPHRGDRLKLLKMAEANAQDVFTAQESKKQTWKNLAVNLKSRLHLSRLPNRIECLDISNIGGELAVGSLVCFTNGEKDKHRYRYYKIRQTKGPDDYAMMAEVLERRFKKGMEGESLPDLLLVDGGKGQLNVALAAINSLGLQEVIDLASIAKGGKGEVDKIYRPYRKNPIVLAVHSPLLLYLMRIRDESHRFGITFHRKWRQKKGLKSLLEEIPGIGEAKKNTLLETFGSLKRLSNASEDELTSVPGVGPQLAKQIFQFIHAMSDESSSDQKQ